MREIALNTYPFNIVLTPDGNRAFVWTASATASFEDINLHTGAALARTHALLGTVNVGINPHFITVFPRSIEGPKQ